MAGEKYHLPGRRASHCRGFNSMVTLLAEITGCACGLEVGRVKTSRACISKVRGSRFKRAFAPAASMTPNSLEARILTASPGRNFFMVPGVALDPNTHGPKTTCS